MSQKDLERRAKQLQKSTSNRWLFDDDDEDSDLWSDVFVKGPAAEPIDTFRPHPLLEEDGDSLWSQQVYNVPQEILLDVPVSQPSVSIPQSSASVQQPSAPIPQSSAPSQQSSAPIINRPPEQQSQPRQQPSSVSADRKPKPSETAGDKGPSESKAPPKGSCKKSSDCPSDQYCDAGKKRCILRLKLGMEGCKIHDECMGPDGACVIAGSSKKRTCMHACRKVGASDGCESGLECTAVPKAQLKGLAGIQGVCLASSSSSPSPSPTKQQSSSPSSGNGLSWIITVCAIFVALGGIVSLFFWMRRRLIRQQRDRDPQHFLFTKSPTPSTPITAPVVQERRASRIDVRLMRMSGAKFTHWAPMPEEPDM